MAWKYFLPDTADFDFSNGIPGQGSASYRPQGLETEGANDQPRQAYGTGLQDYDIGHANGGNWGNYTRSFPAGTFNSKLPSSFAKALNTGAWVAASCNAAVA